MTAEVTAYFRACNCAVRMGASSLGTSMSRGTGRWDGLVGSRVSWCILRQWLLCFFVCIRDGRWFCCAPWRLLAVLHAMLATLWPAWLRGSSVVRLSERRVVEAAGLLSTGLSVRVSVRISALWQWSETCKPCVQTLLKCAVGCSPTFNNCNVQVTGKCVRLHSSAEHFRTINQSTWHAFLAGKLQSRCGCFRTVALLIAVAYTTS